MKNNKLKKICNIFLTVFLILGILSSSFGVSAVVFKGAKQPPENGGNAEQTTQKTNQNDKEELLSPVTEYGDLPNEIELDEDVVIMDDSQSQTFCDSIIGVDTDEYYAYRTTFTLSGEDNLSVAELSSGDYVYIQGDEDSYLSADRIFEIDSIYNYDGNTCVNVREPYFEDVFESMEVSFSDSLTEDNLVKAYYAEGVTSHFGDVSTSFDTIASTSDSQYNITPLSYSTTGTSVAQPQTLSTSGSALQATTLAQSLSANNSAMQLTPLATDYSTKGGDLIIEIDYDFSKNAKKDDNDDEDDEKGIDSSFGIKGSFGVKNLTAHMVSDIPSITDPRELYIGISGEVFANVSPYGKIEYSADMDAQKKDLIFATLEGVSEKRFPIAVFQFKGTTPVYIANAAFKKSEKILPSLYLIVYTDWEGKISLELSGGFEYTNSFNSGVRIIDDGEFCCKAENYPYYDTSKNESEDAMDWYIDLALEADSELTLLGSSVLFYIGRINVGEISAARLGVQAEGETHIKASSKDGLKILSGEDNTFYIRGFLKFIEAKVKLKADGKGILSKLSVDVNFEFALLDLTLFEKGLKPDKYKPKINVSTIQPPNEFESVITLVSDVSGSMEDRIATNQTKLEASKEAAKTIIDITENWASKYTGNYGMGIVQFASNAETVSLPHIDYPFLKNCIDGIGDGGGTTIYQGIDAAVSQLSSVKATTKVIILMTDGQDSNSSSALESAEKASKENIKIYTIGFGNDADENILTQIANATGGEYRYASTDNIIGIIGSFMYAQQSANGEVFAEHEGAVSEGETSKPQSFVVDSMDGDLVATTVWPGSFLDTIVTDPNGRVVDEKYPGATIDESNIPSTLTVKNPIKGKWSVKVKGIETSYENEPFYTVVSFKQIESQAETQEISLIEKLAAHCIPIGIYVSIVCFLLLLCINKKKKPTKK